MTSNDRAHQPTNPNHCNPSRTATTATKVRKYHEPHSYGSTNRRDDLPGSSTRTGGSAASHNAPQPHICAIRAAQGLAVFLRRRLKERRSMKKEPEYWWDFEDTGNILVQSIKNGCIKVCSTVEEAEEFIDKLRRGQITLDSKGMVKK